MKTAYNKYYIQSLMYFLKYNKSWVEIKWYNSDDIYVHDKKKSFNINNDLNNVFLHDYDKTNSLANHIIDNGMYFPISTCINSEGKLMAIAGSHRLHSLHRLGVNIKVMCVDMSKGNIFNTSIADLFVNKEYIHAFLNIHTTPKDNKEKLIKINTNKNRDIYLSMIRLSKNINPLIEKEILTPHSFFNDENSWNKFYYEYEKGDTNWNTMRKL